MSDTDSLEDWEVVPGYMSVIPATPSALSGVLSGTLAEAVAEVRRQLSVVKSALDSRDDWESKAAAHEASEVAKMAVPARKLAGRSGSSRGGGRGKSGRQDPVNTKDLSVRKANLSKVPSSIPKNLNGRITWLKASTQLTNITTQASAITETNYYVTLGSYQQSSSWVGLFDQYCIVQASLKFSSTLAPGSSGTPCVMHSALDLDNTGSLGSINLIDAYTTVQLDTLGVDKVVVRSVRPAVAPDIGGSSGAGSGRMWVDTAYSSIPHYGFRTIVTGGSAYAVQVEQTMWIAFRSGV